MARQPRGRAGEAGGTSTEVTDTTRSARAGQAPDAASNGNGALADGRQLTRAVVDSARQIWLAGLGAFGKSSADGLELFNTLVKAGIEIETHLGKAAISAAGDARSRGIQAWDRLEQVFEDRVSRVLARLGVPRDEDVKELTRRVAELSATVGRLAEAQPAGAQPAEAQSAEAQSAEAQSAGAPTAKARSAGTRSAEAGATKIASTKTASAPRRARSGAASGASRAGGARKTASAA